MKENYKIAIVGLGYVGLPLAIEFGKKFSTIGFDINKNRIDSLNNGLDETLEIEGDVLEQVLVSNIEDLNSGKGLFLTSKSDQIKDSNIFIITVPTPIDKNNRPDLSPLFKASEMVGNVLKKGDIVIYESTVYPGVTEDECAPVLERISGLKFNLDFFCGYSPERINPGDKEHTVSKILKITSGSNPEIAVIIDNLYNTIITAGTHLAPSIKVAEAAKVIENAQRDINIAFINELAKIFNRLDIDTNDVLDAAGTKWNFLRFRPGLVGGHCIGVDPYYLAQKAQEVGYHPEIILSGRRLNDGMGEYVAKEVIKLMVKRDIRINNSKVLILGFSFKENCPDVRNTKVIDIVRSLDEFGVNIVIFDPWADPQEVKRQYNQLSVRELSPLDKSFDAIILAVAHSDFLKLNISALRGTKSIVYDIKGILPKTETDACL
ncbi:nucleotide sugar dehydrogenase [Daejeonella sp.]|uniref:nucleotide sugar dehydrogenase n=1 Tax=Daejeonella sp. TaxID=2805397 RepID=UPI0025C65815|nr:nucleotide sugar dehydrogenase [Daejeonella sp.]